MMGERAVMQEALFCSFRIEGHIPEDHLLRSIDRFVDLNRICEHLKPLYSSTGPPSVGPKLMIRMLIIGYCMGIRSERRARDKDCSACQPTPRCTPNMAARKIMRSVHEGARDMVRDIVTTDAYLISRRQRKMVEILFAHLKRVLEPDRLRLRGPNGAREEFHLAAAAQNLRKLAKIKPISSLTPA